MKERANGEILSPVGSWDMLYSAVRSGANAVYLGAKDFSARRNAENFSKNELSKITEYCHIRNVKVYLTLNILIKDDEFCDALDLAATAYNSGIDGVIIQDLGLAKILREKLPQLPLHASTQMSIHTPSALYILKELGFTQVVCAREMSIKDLTEFCTVAKNLGLVVEVFVHGALCMSMSGQCLLSAFLGSRSGNRGLCAGPCRLPFKAAGGTGYDLSLKDLSLTEFIPTLYNIGVRSFKIEGRMKRPEYVAAATKACKDALLKGEVDDSLSEILKNVFSRSGFTSGYLEDKLGKDMFGIRTKEDVLSAEKAFPLLHEIYRNELQSVPVSVKVRIKENKPITLTLADFDGNEVTVKGDIPDKAQNKPLTYDDVIKNTEKFGGTPYYSAGGGVNLDDGLFVRASQLNTLRREATELLNDKRSKNERTPIEIEYTPKIAKSEKSALPDLLIRVEEKEQIPKDLSGVKAVIVPLEKDFDLTENTINIIDIPRGIISEKTIYERLLTFKEKGFKNCLCGNLSAIKIAKELGFNIIADTALNIHNSESINAAQGLGSQAVVLSNELTIDNILAINSPIPKGIISYGNIPLMLFKNCPIKNGISCKDCDKRQVLTDRLGTEFPVRCRLGYSELLNSVPLWLGDKQGLLRGIDFQILFFTNETPERVNEVITAYKNNTCADCKYTRGLFFRGTI